MLSLHLRGLQKSLISIVNGILIWTEIDQGKFDQTVRLIGNAQFYPPRPQRQGTP
jgi:hypothetical protein